jgi:hypothetical protein
MGKTVILRSVATKNPFNKAITFDNSRDSLFPVVAQNDMPFLIDTHGQTTDEDQQTVFIALK